MSRRIAELLDENPAARAVLLAKHGLVTWGETGEESYRATIEFVTRAARAIDRAANGGSASAARRSRRRGTTTPSACCSPGSPCSAARCSLTRTASILEVDRSPEAVAFASSRAPPR